ncbi:hypothetical protein ACFQ4M_13350 [Thauera mechernichensis]|uniref:Uncharacterized protein n=1 Tax=Thauera mechernichensis TaxID=82788 RepID=A0ABW3WF06_9RHOO|nr:hypothetical protein [Thauera mechernichensis]MDG3064828.1 hypothetical protein [Thauera mechernichensis]
MGFFGSLTGWDQSNAAINALLGVRYLKNADPSERRAVVDQIVKIIQTVQPRLTREQILTDFSKRGIVSQMGFVALACDYLGVPPPIRGNVWTVFKNPYLIGEQVTESHIQAAQYALLKQDGVKVEWPGCNACLDFRMMGGADPEPYGGGDEYDDELEGNRKLVTEEDEEAYGSDLVDFVRRIAADSWAVGNSFLLREGEGDSVKADDIEAFGGDMAYLVRRMAELARALLGRPSPNFSRCPLGSKKDVDAYGAELLELIERIILDQYEAPHMKGILLDVFVREA